jgi:S1-C subfamily serine protease
MTRGKAVFAGLGLAALAAVAAALLVLRTASSPEASPGEGQGLTPAALGLVYVPLNAQASTYYGLEMDRGVLVTEVTPGSMAETAGIMPGDIILSVNGIALGEDVPLIGLMLQPAPEHIVTVELWRHGCVHSVYMLDYPR